MSSRDNCNNILFPVTGGSNEIEELPLLHFITENVEKVVYFVSNPVTAM